jgi:type II secretory pathway component PulF
MNLSEFVVRYGAMVLTLLLALVGIFVIWLNHRQNS